MKQSRYEQETIVSYNAGEQTATIYTRDKAVMRKLDTLVADFPATYKLMKQDEVSKTYSFPKSFVSYRKPRAVNTEQRERARQMMIKQNNSKKFEFLSCVFTDFLLIYLLYKFAQNYAIINGIRSINPIATQIFVTATIG